MRDPNYSHKSLGLVLACTACPHGKVCCRRFVTRLPPLLGVVVKVQRLTLVPQVLIDLLLAERRSLVPLRRSLLLGSGTLSWRASSECRASDREWREVEVVVDLQLVIKDLLDSGGDVVLVLAVEIRRGLVEFQSRASI